MAISIVSDLVLDVVKAANPGARQNCPGGIAAGTVGHKLCQGVCRCRKYGQAQSGHWPLSCNGHCGGRRKCGRPRKTHRPALPSLAVPPILRRVDMAGLVLNANDPAAATGSAKAVNPKGKGLSAIRGLGSAQFRRGDAAEINGECLWRGDRRKCLALDAGRFHEPGAGKIGRHWHCLHPGEAG